MIRVWAAIAIKLGITQEQALLLHGFLRGWLNDLARRKAQIVINDIVERFDLADSDYTQSYAKVLFQKGILTETEAEVFAGNAFKDNGTEPTSKAVAEPEAGDDPGTVRVARTPKPTRGPTDF